MFETQGGTQNRTRDLPKKGSAFITSSDHWTELDVDIDVSDAHVRAGLRTQAAVQGSNATPPLWHDGPAWPVT